jgi:hypothetical protein
MGAFDQAVERLITAQGATTLQPAGEVGPDATPAKTFLLSYHITVCRVMEFDRR